MNAPNLQFAIPPPPPVPTGTDPRLLRSWYNSVQQTIAQCVKVVNSLYNQYTPRAITSSGGAGDPAPADPAYYTTIGSATADGGSEAAEGTDWTVGDVDGSSNKLGCWFYVMSRVGYYHLGDKKLYGYIRKLKIDKFGRVYEVGTETRVEIDVPVVV